MLTAFFPSLYCFFFLKAFLTNPPLSGSKSIGMVFFCFILHNFEFYVRISRPGEKTAGFSTSLLCTVCIEKRTYNYAHSFRLLLRKHVLFLRFFRKPHQNFCSNSFAVTGWFFFTAHVIASFRNNFQNHRWLSEQLFESQACYPKARTSFHTGRISEIVRDFIEARRSFIFNFLR